MDSYDIPDLRLPFATATHPAAEQVQRSTENWCVRMGLLRAPEVAATFHALGYGRIMATLCPYASFDGLALVTDWNSFFFVADDQQNVAVTTHRVPRYESLVAAMRRIIGGDERPTGHDDHPLVMALRDLLARTLPGRPGRWVARLRHNLELWLTGHLAENEYRMSGTVPSVEDYIVVRRAASTVLPTLDLVEVIEGAVISDALYRTPPYQTLVLGTADIMCWISDIHSLHMEQGDPINLVTVLRAHQQWDLQRAVDAVAARIDARVEDHLAALRALPHTMTALGLGPETQEPILRCARDMQSWAAGMEVWDRLDTIRFDGAEPSYADDLLDRT